MWILISLWFAIDQTNYDRTPIVSEIEYQSEESCTQALIDMQQISLIVRTTELSYAICIRSDQINSNSVSNNYNHN